MINTNNFREIDTDLVTLVGEPCVLHYDEEPILFYSNNRYGNILLCSLLEWDRAAQKTFYLYSIVTSEQLADLMDKKISFLQVLETTTNIFLILKNGEDETKGIYKVKLDEIPREYLPVRDSFLFEPATGISDEYVVHLMGGLANRHLVRADELREVQRSFSAYLRKAGKLLKDYFDFPIYIEAYAPGSFEVLFRVVSQENQSTIFDNKSEVLNYLRSVVEGGFKILDYSKRGVPIQKNIESDASKILESYNKALVSMGITKKEENVEILFPVIREGIEELEDLALVIGTGFDKIEISNRSSAGRKSLGSILTGTTKASRETLAVLNKMIGDESTDKDPKVYFIRVYKLNVESRTGSSYIYDSIKPSAKGKRIKFRVEGEDSLYGTIYTNSMDRKRIVQVEGRAVKRRGNIKTLLLT
jgi:hypothetical protein